MKGKMTLIKNIALPLLLVVLAQYLPYRWDATIDKRYTLNENTIALLTALEQPLKIDVFLTGEIPGEYQRLKREIITLLKSMEAHTDELVVGFIDPFDGGESTETLIQEMQQFGLPPEYVVATQNRGVAQTVVFPWAMVNNGTKTIRIPLLDKVLGDNEQQKINRSIAQLEFHFYDAIFKINQKEKQAIAVLTSHGSSPPEKIADFIRSLQPYYQLASFDLKALENDPQKTLDNLRRFPLLMVSNPTAPFTDTEKYLLDQHLMQGGKQWWAVSPVAVNQDSLLNSEGMAVAVGRVLNMESAFFKYGFRLQRNLIKDLYCAPIVLANGNAGATQYLPYTWPYYPLAKPRDTEFFGLQPGHVLMPFSSTIDTLKNNVKKTVLISSSNFSQSLQPPLAIDIKEATEKLNPEDYKLKAQAMGVLLEGEFPSAFENRVKPVKLDQRKENGSSEMMVFSSGTVAENQLENGEPLELGFDKWTRNFYFNKTFLQQTVHYLMGNKELIDVKNKTVELPRLNIEKINNISPSIKIFLLLTPLLLLLFFGGLMHWFRTRKFGQ